HRRARVVADGLPAEPVDALDEGLSPLGDERGLGADRRWQPTDPALRGGCDRTAGALAKRNRIRARRRSLRRHLEIAGEPSPNDVRGYLAMAAALAIEAAEDRVGGMVREEERGELLLRPDDADGRTAPRERGADVEHDAHAVSRRTRALRRPSCRG